MLYVEPVDRIIYKSINVEIELNSNEEKDFAFILGTEIGTDKVKSLIEKYNNIKEIDNELKNVKEYWDKELSTITVKTDDKSFDNVINGWFKYQTIASRIYARAGFYQVGGAFGFRDQLQDSINLVTVNPELAKKQIIINASHQFMEGDVLHWWHENNHLGLRSRYKDDYLWLIYAVSEYCRVTEDYKILEEKIPFVSGQLLAEFESERGMNFSYTNETATLYEHCLIALNLSMYKMGNNGLPLMGGGDWNDGMNKIGIGGIGTSVWLGFFQYAIVERFIELTKKYDSKIDITKYKKFNEKLKEKLNSVAWDGKYYLRAFYDNGNKLGSLENSECKIDLISQSFSILTNIIPKDRIKSVIESVEENLVDRKIGIIKLLDPPFGKTKDIPGYIMDYPKGIRENGGQYTHASSWYIMSLLKIGMNDKAYDYYQMINPINRTLTKSMVDTYMIEPYVIAGDIYSNYNHPGRGGWSWYSGSSGWFYNIGLTKILGFNKKGNKISFNPNVPTKWKKFELEYHYQDTIYKIKVNLKQDKDSITMDGELLDKSFFTIKNDKRVHAIIINKKG